MLLLLLLVKRIGWHGFGIGVGWRGDDFVADGDAFCGGLSVGIFDVVDGFKRLVFVVRRREHGGRVRRSGRRRVPKLQFGIGGSLRRVVVRVFVAVKVCLDAATTTGAANAGCSSEYLSCRGRIPFAVCAADAGGTATRRRPRRREADCLYALIDVAVAVAAAASAVRLVDGVMSGFGLKKRKPSAEGRI